MLVISAIVFVFAYAINLFFISVVYHRGLCHGAVRLRPGFKRFAVSAGSWITGIDAKAWVCMHRNHHQHSDTDMDPHSPLRFGVLGVAMGQLRSYERTLGGLIRGRTQYTSVVSDLDFPVHWFNRRKVWYLPYLLHAVIGLALSLLSGYALLGAAYWLGMMSHPVQGWMVNSLAHKFGYRNFETTDNSKNNSIVSWLVVGEGYQNNHHHNPGGVKFSVRRGEFDAGYGMCLAARKFGLIEF